MSVRAAAQALLDALDGDGFSLHDLRNAEEALRAALAADTVEVPRVPTNEMFAAYVMAVTADPDRRRFKWIDAFRVGYRAMIEAAQEAKG